METKYNSFTNNAWDKFATTGKIDDYLKYKKAKDRDNGKNAGFTGGIYINDDKNNRNYSEEEKYRGKTR